MNDYERSMRDTPITEPAKPTAEQTAEALKIVYDGNKATKPLEIPPGELHGYAHLESTLDRRLPELWAEAGVDSKEQQTLRHNVVMMPRETGLDETIIATIAEGVIDAKVAAAKSTTPEADADRLEAQILSDTAASRIAMRDKYGIADGEALLARTVAFVKARPGLAAALAYGGMGSRKDIVLALAAHVFSQGIR